VAGAGGIAGRAAPLSGSGPTVWETFKPYDQVFRSRAEAPAPWGSPDLSRGGPRRLATFHQTGGGVLVDRAGKPVYYEMVINRDEFAYVVVHKPYDAAAQRAFAQRHGIVLPAGPTRDYGRIGTIEIKAAWKILSTAERAASPRRFHTAEAVLEDGARVTRGPRRHASQSARHRLRARGLGELRPDRQRTLGGRRARSRTLFLLRSRLRCLRRQCRDDAAALNAGRTGVSSGAFGARDQ
jgi:hypothetical protein